MGKPVVLSQDAARMVRDASRITAHTPRGTRPETPPLPWNPPYIGFCLTPSGGIPAMAGTTPGHDECSIYWGGPPDETTLDRVLADCDNKEEIYNPTTTAASCSTIYPFWRANCGTLFIAPSSSSTGGGLPCRQFTMPSGSQTLPLSGSYTTILDGGGYLTEHSPSEAAAAVTDWTKDGQKIKCETTGYYLVHYTFTVHPSPSAFTSQCSFQFGPARRDPDLSEHNMQTDSVSEQPSTACVYCPAGYRTRFSAHAAYIVPVYADGWLGYWIQQGDSNNSGETAVFRARITVAPVMY